MNREADNVCSSCKNCGSAVTGQQMAFPSPIRPSLKPTASSTPSTLVFKSEPSQGLAKELLREDYLKIVVDKIGAANKSITQDFVQVERLQVFKQKTLIFVASKTMTDTLGVVPRMVESMMAASQEAQTNGADGDKMLGKRKRKCFECGHADETTRTFPSNSRTTLQKQLLDRLGLDRQETIEKYEEYREKLGKGVDIRWFSKHLNTGETLPIDLRLKPLLATTPLREKLQPHRLNLRYRNHTMCSTPAVSDNEVDMDYNL
ncbi:hypothetical protein PRIPAC_75505 [Pristionchus pacificus]|uniref:Uncharacterized protein n=1 Tax=Pristionchus pacificus TaxID=54126 RepID=A0A2A6C8G2_PRIPA|nr:hypothetical protein PRIPAC_75505 [Pristionchus pacificus]|eukprot:PDM74449.1 hypothetical protein PRIPAC_41805 [Pristionchus pacificus]